MSDDVMFAIFFTFMAFLVVMVVIVFAITGCPDSKRPKMPTKKSNMKRIE